MNNDKKINLINDLKRIEKITGKIPRTIDLQNMKGFSDYKTYLKYFGTWENALEAAGFKCPERNFGWNLKNKGNIK